MAILVSVQGLAHAFGVRPLFEGVSFTLSDGDRVGLIGPNGAGKSTLLKILAGVMAPDRGRVAPRVGLRVGYLPQVPIFSAGVTVRAAIREALPASHGEAWQGEARIDELVSKLDLDLDAAGADAPMDQLSGGWRKRVALAQALVGQPDLLLLDEPTNHLDVDGILWLERLLAAARFATVIVTHDRQFLQSTTSRILELDRRNQGGLMDVAGGWATYVDRKAESMAAQERREQALRNTLRRETEWLRRGPPARTTKQDARIQRAGALAEEVAELGARNRVRTADLDFQGSGRRPKRLLEAHGISKRYDDRSVFFALDLFVGPGTRLGLLGPNGCGKSTLLRVLTGQEAPSAGTVLRADGVQIAFFEQNRDSLDLDSSLADAVCPDGDYVDFRGARVHRFGYLERFLFRPEQMSLPVGRLSGGEQSRVLVARLMLRPANVLVLDEPTNDLDLATLTVLEDALTSFEGAVLLVTHDRFFLDQVATQILAFHSKPGEEGQTTMLAGLRQWEKWHSTQTVSRRVAEARGAQQAPRLDRSPGKKLSFKDQRDFDTLEARLAAAETKLAQLEAECTRPEVVVDGERLMALDAEMTATRAEIDRLYARWGELEGVQ